MGYQKFTQIDNFQVSLSNLDRVTRKPTAVCIVGFRDIEPNREYIICIRDMRTCDAFMKQLKEARDQVWSVNSKGGFDGSMG